MHGEDDESLPSELSVGLVRALCAAGVVVEYRAVPDAGHDAVLAASAADSARWLAGRLTGDAAPTSCGEG